MTYILSKLKICSRCENQAHILFDKCACLFDDLLGGTFVVNIDGLSTQLIIKMAAEDDRLLRTGFDAVEIMESQYRDLNQQPRRVFLYKGDNGLLTAEEGRLIQEMMNFFGSTDYIDIMAGEHVKKFGVPFYYIELDESNLSNEDIPAALVALCRKRFKKSKGDKKILLHKGWKTDSGEWDAGHFTVGKWNVETGYTHIYDPYYHHQVTYQPHSLCQTFSMMYIMGRTEGLVEAVHYDDPLFNFIINLQLYINNANLALDYAKERIIELRTGYFVNMDESVPSRADLQNFDWQTICTGIITLNCENTLLRWWDVIRTLPNSNVNESEYLFGEREHIFLSGNDDLPT